MPRTTRLLSIFLEAPLKGLETSEKYVVATKSARNATSYCLKLFEHLLSALVFCGLVCFIAGTTILYVLQSRPTNKQQIAQEDTNAKHWASFGAGKLPNMPAQTNLNPDAIPSDVRCCSDFAFEEIQTREVPESGEVKPSWVMNDQRRGCSVWHESSNDDKEEGGAWQCSGGEDVGVRGVG